MSLLHTIPPATASLASPTEAAEEGAPRPTRRIVAYHLFLCAAMVYLIIIVGGLTRLTESGLSITEWNPGFKGMKLPWTDAEWDAEWEKYKRTPEWSVLNQHMTVHDFKKIYLWEWSHRILGRLIGVTFVLPTLYFLARGYIAKGSRWKVLAIAGGIGFQGFLGWFMVKSGLSSPDASPPAIAQSHMNSPVSSGVLDPRQEGQASTLPTSISSPDWHPRVSQFRLAAHLGTAFLVYLGMLHSGITILRKYNVHYHTGKVSGWDMNVPDNVFKLYNVLGTSRVARFRNVARGVTALVFVTAMTGALVAGLDAGLVYSEFPYMGEGIVPPKEELLDTRYALNADAKSTSKLVIGNASQNPVTVQFMHRCLAMTTLVSVIGLGIYSRRLASSMRQSTALSLPRAVPRLAILASVAATMQASLGISTLIYLVPIELASAHQAGSVALLSVMTALLACLGRRPSTAWRSMNNHAVASPILRQVRIKS
ncbi:hypothetical protein CBS101457_004639 [Exobasidium rhododendri]|nr:hypothetical protein CBS101457_004639 [Exobasidium rhododendri]